MVLQMKQKFLENELGKIASYCLISLFYNFLEQDPTGIQASLLPRGLLTSSLGQ